MKLDELKEFRKGFTKMLATWLSLLIMLLYPVLFSKLGFIKVPEEILSILRHLIEAWFWSGLGFLTASIAAAFFISNELLRLGIKGRDSNGRVHGA